MRPEVCIKLIGTLGPAGADVGEENLPLVVCPTLERLTRRALN